MLKFLIHLFVGLQVFVIENALLSLRHRSGRSKAWMWVVSLHHTLHKLLV